MSADAHQPCPGCGLRLRPHDGPVHPYIGASAACWALYGTVLAREYGDAALMGRSHQCSVDAYAAQHPGIPGRRSAQSVWAHLASLYVLLECGMPEAASRELMKRIASTTTDLSWLAPPHDPGAVTVADVASAAGTQMHHKQVIRWAESVWSSWSAHHDAVRTFVGTIAPDLTPPADPLHPRAYT